jgi:solute carrier family 25 carnitine/acylcarnitine transporter 20/29
MQAAGVRGGGGGGGESALAVAARVIAADGVQRGLYRGWAACALARSSNYAYFGGFAAASELLAFYAPPRSAAARTRNTLASGAAAGVLYWLCAMPFDTLKGRMMAAPDGVRPWPTLRGAARELLATAGPAGFYRGLTPALVRAVPANAAAFLTFEETLRWVSAAPAHAA